MMEQYYSIPKDKMAVLKVFLANGITSKRKFVATWERPNKDKDKILFSDGCNCIIKEGNAVSFYLNSEGGYYDIYHFTNALYLFESPWSWSRPTWRSLLKKIGAEGGEYYAPEEADYWDASRLRFRTIKGLRFEILTPTGIIRPSRFNAYIKEAPAKAYFWHRWLFAGVERVEGNADGHSYVITGNLIEVEITEPAYYDQVYWLHVLSEIAEQCELMARLYKAVLRNVDKCVLMPPRIVGDAIKDHAAFVEAAKEDYETHEAHSHENH